MIQFVVAIVIAILVFVIVSSFDAIKHRNVRKNLIEECERNRTQFLKDLKNEYGEITKILKNPYIPTQYNLQRDEGSYVIQLHTAKKLIINRDMFDYSDITEYELYEDIVSNPADNITISETKTNMKNLIGRAVVGGVLAGGVGALIGGATAAKTTKTVERTSYGISMLYLKISAKNKDVYIRSSRDYMSCSIHQKSWNIYIKEIEKVLQQVIEYNAKIYSEINIIP